MEAVVSESCPPPAGPYSHVARAGGLLFTAGFGPQDPVTGAVAGTVGEQTAQVLKNVESALAEYGATLADVVKVTTHLEHPERDFAEYNAAYERHFQRPYPVRTTVGSRLANILVEIDVVAVDRSR